MSASAETKANKTGEMCKPPGITSAPVVAEAGGVGFAEEEAHDALRMDLEPGIGPLTGKYLFFSSS